MRKQIAIVGITALTAFNLFPTVSRVFEVPLIIKKVELKKNNSLDFKSKVKAVPEEPKPSFKEVKAVITYYTASADECGNNKGITASGKKVSRGMVAAPKHIPFGTRIEIDGKIYTVEDRGGDIKVKNGVYYLDVYVPTKKEAIQRGRQVRIVKIYE